MKQYCNTNMFHAVLVTSAICTVHEPLDYTTTRSAFTHEQRFEQSLQTIQTLRDFIPNAYIVFLESTKIPEYMEQTISQMVGYYFDASVLDWVTHYVNGPYKSMGEIATILAYLQCPHFQDHRHMFESLSKISGRYKLEHGFQFQVVPDHILAKVEFNPQYHDVEYMSTMFYTVPQCLFDSLVQVCNDCFQDPAMSTGKPLECGLLRAIERNNINVHRVGTLYVGGEYGPWGGYVMH